MAWVELPGVKGKIYRPDPKPEAERKHNCEDCYSCQMCSDNRCVVCRSQNACAKKNPAKS